MKREELEHIKNQDQLVGKLADVLAISNYDARAGATEEFLGTKEWSLSELVNAEDYVSLAAACLLHGFTPKGKPAQDADKPDSMGMKIRLKVLSRQACYCDKDGNILEQNRYNSKCVKPEEKPKSGDVIQVKKGLQVRDPKTKKPLDKAIRRRLINAGVDLNAYNTYVVDKHGCVEMTLQDAFATLQLKSELSMKPKMLKLDRAIRNKNGQVDDNQTRILNWLFKEVSEHKTESKEEIKDAGNQLIS